MNRERISIIISLLLVLAFVCGAMLIVAPRIAAQGDMWTSDSDIVSGLSDVGWNSAPSVFEWGGNTYLIAGESDGVFNGWQWNGSSWASDSGIISGLSDVGARSAPSAFELSGNIYLIAGEAVGVFNGWQWNGSSWASDSGIISGLSDVGYSSTPSVFEWGGNTYLIAGNDMGVFEGWQWNGSSWTSDSDIVSGLSDVGWNSTPSVFEWGGNTYLIAGNDMGVFEGWQWNGSSWTSDSGIISGLSDVGDYSAPSAFELSGNIYLIAGESTGVFNGWVASLAPTPTPTATATATATATNTPTPDCTALVTACAYCAVTTATPSPTATATSATPCGDGGYWRLPVSVIADNHDNGYVAAYMADGDINSMWKSLDAAQVYITATLDSMYDVSAIRLYADDFNAGCAGDGTMVLQYLATSQDAESWTTICGEDSLYTNWYTDDIGVGWWTHAFTATAQYVRLAVWWNQCIDGDPFEDKSRVSELQVGGCAAVTPTATATPDCADYSADVAALGSSAADGVYEWYTVDITNSSAVSAVVDNMLVEWWYLFANSAAQSESAVFDMAGWTTWTNPIWLGTSEDAVNDSYPDSYSQDDLPDTWYTFTLPARAWSTLYLDFDLDADDAAFTETYDLDDIGVWLFLDNGCIVNTAPVTDVMPECAGGVCGNNTCCMHARDAAYFAACLTVLGDESTCYELMQLLGAPSW